MSDISIKQGQSAQITITLDETLNGELYVGMYRKTDNTQIMLVNTEDSSLSGSGKVYTMKLSHETTKALNTGTYYIELLTKNESGTYVSISDKIEFSVTQSTIGKEV